MKYSILIVCSLCFSTCTYSQSPGDDFAFTSNVVLQRFNPFTKTIAPDPSNIYLTKRGTIFTIKSKETIAGVAGFSIEFWHFNSNKSEVVTASIYANGPAGVNYRIIDGDDNGIIYFISATDLAKDATPEFRRPKGAVKLDALVLPIKLRFKNKQPGGDFDFQQSISIGPAVSFNRNYGGAFGKTSTAFLLGLNITNVPIDEKTAPEAITTKTTLLGLSPFVGFNVDYQGISFNILSGIEVLTGRPGEVWAYRKSPWIGISVGGTLVSSKKENQ